MATKERIKAWRESLGMSHAEFSELSGIPIVSLRRYETTDSRLGDRAKARLKSTGVNMMWLLKGAGPMSSASEILEARADMTPLKDWINARVAEVTRRMHATTGEEFKLASDELLVYCDARQVIEKFEQATRS